MPDDPLTRLAGADPAALLRWALHALTDGAAWRTAGRTQYAVYRDLLLRDPNGGRLFGMFRGGYIGLFGVATALMQLTPVAADDWRLRAINLGVSAGLILLGLWWALAPFPSYAAGLVAVGVGGVLILADALTAFEQPTARIVLTSVLLSSGLFVCMAYGGRVLLLQSAFAAAIIATVTASAHRFGGVPLWDAAPFTTMAALVAIAIPVALQFLVDFVRPRAVLLSDESIRDPLTGLLNRRGWDQQSPRLVSRCPDGYELLVVAIDVDRFKVANDTRGHAGGDELLRRMGRRLSDLFGDGVVVRLGGDEFLAAAHAPSDRHVEALAAACARPLTSPDGTVTVSVGVAHCRPYPRLDLATLVNQADHAMYRVKQAGGDGIGRTTP